MSKEEQKQVKKVNKNKTNNNKIKEKKESSVKVEKIEPEKKRISKQSIGTLAVGILALIALIIAFIINKGANGSKKSQEVLDNFYKYMESTEATVIYYGSSTCSYCELQTPIMEQIQQDYDMDYLYIDASLLTDSEKDEILDTLDADGSTPTIAVVSEGQVQDINVGYLDGTNMVEFLKENEVLDSDATYKPEENLTFIDFDEYKELVDSDATSIIVIGQTGCSHCIAAKPVLSHVAGTYNLEINYLNLTDMSSDEQSELIESLKNIGYEDADNLGTPLTIVVNNKQIETTIEGENPPSYFTREFKKVGLIAE